MNSGISSSEISEGSRRQKLRGAFESYIHDIISRLSISLILS